MKASSTCSVTERKLSLGVINGLKTNSVLTISAISASVDQASLVEMVKKARHGSRSAIKGLRDEEVVRKILRNLDISYQTGILKDSQRDMDTVVPSRQNPLFIIENSHTATTASGMGDKAGKIATTVTAFKKIYPDVQFLAFVDGPGWLRRVSDLKTILEVADDVFTYHRTQLAKRLPS